MYNFHGKVMQLMPVFFISHCQLQISSCLPLFIRQKEAAIISVNNASPEIYIYVALFFKR